MSASPTHIPVLAAPCLELLQPAPGGRFIDCTVNGAGLSSAILGRTAPNGHLLAIDTDGVALGRARERLAIFGERVIYAQANFRSLESVARETRFTEVDGVVMDLGLSSIQLDDRERGFAFSQEGPLDMRYDQTRGQRAADFVATADAAEIERTLRAFGEEPRARRIAEAIVAQRRHRPIATTTQLADVVASVTGRRGRIHPATRTFQALRIAVNDELNALREALPQAVRLLRRGARLAVISFHSLEDRMVKAFFASLSGRPVESRLPVPPPTPPAEIRIITRHPVMAPPEERMANPRSRSARLRVAERV
ncbi:MAG: 16S rRNA (cytosine(1402)-N(4))-methyltransferase RsmH [Chloroflexi bacterium]|nr:16S rRNA (cytosine(1402)-N(4))-methyltransferase RsmH [Chloroflexota bacterium]